MVRTSGNYHAQRRRNGVTESHFNQPADNVDAMNSRLLFHPDMKKGEFASLLELHFDHITDANQKMVEDIKASLGTLPTRGQPVDLKKIELFRHADAEKNNGATIEVAVVRAMVRYPDIKPRRSLIKMIAGHDDPDHDKGMLITEYKRYRSRKANGLDPSVSYSTNNFFEFILTKQWGIAAAIFIKANELRRSAFCTRLNEITSKQRE